MQFKRFFPYILKIDKVYDSIFERFPIGTTMPLLSQLICGLHWER